ncbi:MAG: hypothetical protein GYA52_07015 [Chloroflexi bacterium]|nr:hypothetical protein [Chloroflexota bacterium]
MPAVDLTLLNTRVQSLQLFRSDPRVYLAKLDDLLVLYTTEKIKLGENVPIQTLLPQKNIPDLVLHKIIETFPSLAAEYPDNAVYLSDALWGREHLEFKLLAIHLLMSLPSSQWQEIGSRLPRWTAETDEELLRKTILDLLARSDIDNIRPLRAYIEQIFTSQDQTLRKLAFQSLVNMIEQKDFNDLPWVFRIISPMIKEASLPLVRELSQIIIALIKKSEIETAAFLCDMYQQSNNEKARKFIRKVTPLFSAEKQNILNQVIAQY